MQWVNQSFNAVVNYTNRNASAGVTTEQLGQVGPTTDHTHDRPTTTLPAVCRPAAMQEEDRHHHVVTTGPLPAWPCCMDGPQAYAAATVASVSTAVGFNRFIANNPALSKGPIGRFVPLIAVAAANCVNIPLMRQVRRPRHCKEVMLMPAAPPHAAGPPTDCVRGCRRLALVAI